VLDILSAFRLLILHPDEFELFGFHFKNQFYFDKCLPMGCSASCALFENFSTFLEWAIKFKSGKRSVEHYLDDFLLSGKAGTGECLQLMDRFRIICEDLGVSSNMCQGGHQCRRHILLFSRWSHIIMKLAHVHMYIMI